MQGYSKQVVAGTLYQAKIKVAESGETPVVHVKVMQHLPHTGKGPEIQMFKKDQTEEAPFAFGEMDMVFRTCMMGMIEEPMEVVEEPAAAGGNNEEMKDESQPTDAAAATEAEAPQGQSISSMVNQSEVTMLMDMGFSRNVSEKACFMVQGAGIERAMGWIEDNREQPDFEEALMIMGQAEGGAGVPGKPS